ncbi:hypothetical protein DFH07DRAFT_302155 [Mycena maculata]|uniref:Uncharacterized protein n=1 Tax=Mycena maculata TaxID=230809 RepID=A0AAD7HJD7_9AGAR|nr:hypothetical protein DFH07DRAFT_302155 [Mycena maculata]
MPPKRKRSASDSSDEESFGRQILPVANLPADFEGTPEDGMQYLFTVRRDARHLPHVTRVANPYEIPERLPPPPSDNLPAVHPALPSPEWRTSFETHYKNFRKNFAQPTIHVYNPAQSQNDGRKLIPDLKERDLWWAFLSGRPAAEWDIPKKPKGQNARNFQRGMRAFADDPEVQVPFIGSSRSEALVPRPMYDDPEVRAQPPTPSGTPAPIERPAPDHSIEETPIYKPREPTPSLLRLVDQRMALHLLMYFTHWTNLHMQPEKLCRVTQTHARWIFVLLSRVDDYISADDMHLLRNLARAYLALLKDLTRSTERLAADDINPGSCWLIISTVVGIWGQRDLWMDAEEMIRCSI